MRSAVLIGTDFAYDSKGKLIPLEINTNVGWDTVNRKESVDEIFDFTDLSMYVRENAIKEILLEGKIAEICKDAIQKAIPHVTVSEATMGDYEEEHPNTTLFIRTAWSSQALVDTFAASKEKFKSLIKSEDFCEGFSEPSGNLPNLVVKAIDPQYDKLTYPKFYKADVSTFKVPHGFIVEPAVLNVDNLVEGRIPVFRNWSLFVAGENGDKIDTIYLGTYTKVCGDEFDESKLKYDSDGALVEGRGMLLSLDGLSTQWPADALVEASDEVLMSDGSWKKASELKVGDKVKSLQFEDDLDIRHHVGQLTTTEKELKKSFAVATVDFLTRTRGYRDFVEIKFNDKSDWFDTANSSYLVKRESGLEFDYISNLKKGDVVYFLKDGSKLATKTVETTGIVRKYVDTYNVGLAENHIFFSRGEGETSAFASLEHNDTEDCSLEPKSQNGAFQTFVSFDGSTEAKNTLNISSAGVLVNSGSVSKTFTKTSGTASANGEYVNPNDYSSDKGGFTGCWYPLAGNSTWNINVPLTTVDGVKSVATIVRIGSADGNALNGSNTYWKITEISSTGSNILWPVTFDSAIGPCKLHVQVYQPSDIIQITEPTGKNFEVDGTLTSGDSTTTLTFARGVGTKGSITGSVRFSNDYISFSSRSANIAEDGTIDTAEISETTAKFKTSMSKNTEFTERVGSVSTYVGPKSSESLVGRYSVIQAALKPTLAVEVNPGGDIILPGSYDADYVLRSYEVSVISNAPWKVTTVSADGNFDVSKQGGSGNGSFDITEISSSIKEYSYDRSETYELGSVIISTDTGTKNDVSYTIPVYGLKKLFVAPRFVTSSNANAIDNSTQTCLSEYYADNELNVGDLVYLEYSDGSGNSGWSDVSGCQRIQNNTYTVENPLFGTDTGFTFVDCVPIAVHADCVGSQDMTLSVGSSDLDQLGFSYGFTKLGSAKNGLYGRYLPYVYRVASVSLDSVVNLTGSVYPDDTLFSTETSSKTADNLCLVIGTEQLSDAHNSSYPVGINLMLEYTDLVDGKRKRIEKPFTIGNVRPSIDVLYEETSWSSSGQTMNSLPSHSFQSTISLSGLQESASYRLVASPGISIDFGGENLLNVAYTGNDWMDFQTMWEDAEYPIVSVPENSSTTPRYRAIALVPAESSITSLSEPTDTGDLCLDGNYYSYMVGVQDVKVEEAKELNSIDVVCNVREVTWTQTDEMAAVGKQYQINALYDVTASASSPVSSSVSFTCTPKPVGNVNTGEGPYGTGSVSVTIGSGNSLTTNAPGVFGYAYYGSNVSDGDPIPSIGTLDVSTISPTVDSVFDYEIGSVRVRDIPSLGGPDTLVITDFDDSSVERQVAVASYNLEELGYEVSCSAGLTGSVIGSSNVSYVVFTTGSRILLGEVYTASLRRNGKEVSRRKVQVGSGPIRTLKASPSEIYKDLGAFSETVVLYTGSSVPLTGLSASTITSSSAWIGVARSSGNYKIDVTSQATASRSGSVTFKVDGVGTATVSITQTAVDNTLYVWYCPNDASEVQLGSGAISFNSESAFSVVGSNYDYRFRYENASGGTFMPVFEKAAETGPDVRILGNFATELGDYMSDTSGDFFLRIGRVSSPMTNIYRLGSLSFNAENLKIPASVEIRSSVR